MFKPMTRLSGVCSRHLISLLCDTKAHTPLNAYRAIKVFRLPITTARAQESVANLQLADSVCDCPTLSAAAVGRLTDMAEPDVTEEMRVKGRKLCKEFLGGRWTTLTPEEFSIERVKGGLSNMMYLCSLPKGLEPEGDEPGKVLLRIYGQIIKENPETVVTDSVIYGLLAEKKKGPKLYGVFTEGRVEEYVESRILHCHDLRKPDISAACARIMAGFHKLRMPLVKQPRWLCDTITRYLDEALNNVNLDVQDKAKRERLQKLLSIGLPSEFRCLKKIIDQTDSPVVFCHNDMQEGNILYSENPGKGWHLIPIDFEYASYNWRGFDIANHFAEWCYDYQTLEEHPHFIAEAEKYPTKEQQIVFLKAYLEGDPKFAADPEGVINGLLKEIAVFVLASDFMWGLWSLVQSSMSGIAFGYLEYSFVRFDAYFSNKKKLLEEYEFKGV